jgi:hypothetical protein
MSNKSKKPLLVYLDYNVIVSIQSGDYTIDHIKKIAGTSNVVFPFSASHIEEVKNIKDGKTISRFNAINERLTFIDRLTKKQYLERIDFDMPYKKRSVSAYDVYSTLNEVSAASVYYELFTNFITEKQKQEYRDRLQLDSKKLNNIRPSEIVEHLNSNFLLAEHSMSFMDMIKKASSYFPNKFKHGIETHAGAIFALLDALGYWKDRYTETSNVARLWDSSHCGFASFCDILVSQDERMRLKSEVVYHLLNINTKILSLKIKNVGA